MVFPLQLQRWRSIAGSLQAEGADELYAFSGWIRLAYDDKTSFSTIFVWPARTLFAKQVITTDTKSLLQTRNQEIVCSIPMWSWCKIIERLSSRFTSKTSFTCVKSQIQIPRSTEGVKMPRSWGALIEWKTYHFRIEYIDECFALSLWDLYKGENSLDSPILIYMISRILSVYGT